MNNVFTPINYRKPADNLRQFDVGMTLDSAVWLALHESWKWKFSRRRISIGRDQKSTWVQRLTVYTTSCACWQVIVCAELKLTRVQTPENILTSLRIISVWPADDSRAAGHESTTSQSRVQHSNTNVTTGFVFVRPFLVYILLSCINPACFYDFWEKVNVRVQRKSKGKEIRKG